MPSDLSLFTAALTEHLPGWTATIIDPDQHDRLADAIWEKDVDLREAFTAANEAAVLTTPADTRLLAVDGPRDDGTTFLVGALSPDAFPRNARASLNASIPRAFAVNGSNPVLGAARIRIMFSHLDEHFALVAAAIEPEEAARRDGAFTEYTQSLAAALPTGWQATPLDLHSQDWTIVHGLLWSSGHAVGPQLIRSAARAALLHGPDDRWLTVVQDVGPSAALTAGALIPSDLNAGATDMAPGPALLPLARNAEAAASQLRERLLPAYERGVWSARIGHLDHATVEIRQALHSWDAVSDSYADPSGMPEGEEWGEGQALRDTRAWNGVQVYLQHAPAVLEGIASVTSGTEYLTGGLSTDLRAMESVARHLSAVVAIHQEWQTRFSTAPAKELPFLADERNAEIWHHATELEAAGDAMLRVARKVTDRIGAPPDPPGGAVARRPAPTPPPPGLAAVTIASTRRAAR
ncbi:hypothetical protein [Streptomyces griseoaurantiacus]|uniref:Uncharacterized protein n=1 Tax=Streptomyces griseoaurantiacus TaxID=68213 RepID=A0A7W2DX08_9ACTN|nr:MULTISPECIES: hypothetical protein [Streptomyces]MBA5224579.1 hypothetical protein [Streptomyces griseoaurantiacus]